ncbi:hypothetical protein HGE74_09470 [Rhodobacteraceae bacterium R_SAG1]|nr:hypothetical protein [Rhodobacteraceae bacterium R_SAG1]
MRNEKYNRLLRSLTASILSSDLTDKELKDLFELLETKRLNRDLQEMLEGFVWSMPSHTQSKYYREDDYADVVLQIGAPKAALHNVISSMLGQDAPAKSKTMREMIHDFEAQASLEQRKKLLDILKVGLGDDEYLRGIAERSK